MIKINDEYYIDTDTYSFVLKKVHFAKDKKTGKEKDKKWIDRINDSIIAYELSEKINFDKPDNSRIIEALKILLEGETDE